MATSEPSAPGLVERIRRFLGAWQPFTGRGLKAFVSASFARILCFQVVAAWALAALVMAALRHTWIPVLGASISELPEAASIESGRLLWPDATPRRLAENPWLSIVVRPPNASGDIPGQSSDLQLELHPAHVRLTGVFGHLEQPYPRLFHADLGRIPATATLRAWYQPGCAIVAGGVFLFLLLSWWGLATVYAPCAWLFARLSGRAIPMAGAWRLAAAALFSGACLGGAGIAAYATGAIRLPGLLVTQILHVPIVWLWLLWGLLSLDRGARQSQARRENPFSS